MGLDIHADRKALLVPLMKRAELVMADYEAWITSGGTSIVLSPVALEQNAGTDVVFNEKSS